MGVPQDLSLPQENSFFKRLLFLMLWKQLGNAEAMSAFQHLTEAEYEKRF